MSPIKRIVRTTSVYNTSITYDKDGKQIGNYKEETEAKQVTIEIEGEDAIAQAVIEALNIEGENIKVEFDCGADWLRGCIVTYKEKV